jgi:hypothetical protein
VTPLPDDEARFANASREEIMSDLFTGMAMQLASTALIFLGQLPHPETNETVVDLEAAKMFIDQLEMLEFKTRGNLNTEEAKIIREGIAAATEVFVQAINAQGSDESAFVPIMKPAAE